MQLSCQSSSGFFPVGFRPVSGMNLEKLSGFNRNGRRRKIEILVSDRVFVIARIKQREHLEERLLFVTGVTVDG